MNPSAWLKYKLSISSKQTGNGKLFIGKRSPFFGFSLTLWSFRYAFIIYTLLTPTSCWELGFTHAGCFTNTEVIIVIDYFKFEYKFIGERLSNTPWDNVRHRDLNTSVLTDGETAMVQWGTLMLRACTNQNSLQRHSMRLESHLLPLLLRPESQLHPDPQHDLK